MPRSASSGVWRRQFRVLALPAEGPPRAFPSRRRPAVARPPAPGGTRRTAPAIACAPSPAGTRSPRSRRCPTRRCRSPAPLAARRAAGRAARPRPVSAPVPARSGWRAEGRSALPPGGRSRAGAAVRVMLEREVPGTRASAWAQPTRSAAPRPNSPACGHRQRAWRGWPYGRRTATAHRRRSPSPR